MSGGMNVTHVASAARVRDALIIAKAVLYRDTVSVDTGSRHFFGSMSVSKTHFDCICTICIASTYAGRADTDTLSSCIRPTKITPFHPIKAKTHLSHAAHLKL